MPVSSTEHSPKTGKSGGSLSVPSPSHSAASPGTFDLPVGTALPDNTHNLKQVTKLQLILPVGLTVLCLVALLLATIRVADTAGKMNSRISAVLSAAEQDATGAKLLPGGGIANSTALGSLSLLQQHAASIFEHELRNKSMRAHSELCEAGFRLYATTASTSSNPTVTVADLTSRLVWSFFDGENQEEDEVSGDYWSVLCVRKSTASACDITSVGCVSGRSLPASFGFVRTSSNSSSSSSLYSFVAWENGKRLLVSRYSHVTAAADGDGDEPGFEEWAEASDETNTAPVDYTSISSAHNGSAWPTPAPAGTAADPSFDLVLSTSTDAAAAGRVLQSESAAAANSVFDSVVTKAEATVRTVSRVATSQLLAAVSSTLGSRMRGAGAAASASASDGSGGATAFFVGVNGSAAKSSSTTDIVVSATLGPSAAETVLSGWADAPHATQTAMRHASSTAADTNVVLLASPTATPASISGAPLVAAVATTSCVSSAASATTAFKLNAAFAAALPNVTCGVALGWDAFAADAAAIIDTDVTTAATTTIVAAVVVAIVVALILIAVCVFLVMRILRYSDQVQASLVLASRIVNAAGILDTQRLTFFETPEQIAADQEEEEARQRMVAGMKQQKQNPSDSKETSQPASPLTAAAAAAAEAKPATTSFASSLSPGSTPPKSTTELAVPNPLSPPAFHQQQQQQHHHHHQHQFSSSSLLSDNNQQSSGVEVPPLHEDGSGGAYSSDGEESGSAGSGSAGRRGNNAADGGGDIGDRWAKEHHSQRAFNDALQGSFGNAVQSVPSGTFAAQQQSKSGVAAAGPMVNEDKAVAAGSQPATTSPAVAVPGSSKSKNSTTANSKKMALFGGVNATEELSDITEVAQLQLRLNKLCAAAVESRTVIPAVAFDLFYAQFEDAHRQASSQEAILMEEAEFLHQEDGESLSRAAAGGGGAGTRAVSEGELQQQQQETNPSSRSQSPTQSLGGASAGSKQQQHMSSRPHSLRNSPQANALDGGIIELAPSASAVMAASSGGIGLLGDGSPAGDGPLPMIQVQAGGESISSYPNASLSEHPLADGNGSLGQHPCVNSPAIESLQGGITSAGTVPPNCPIRPRRKAVVLSASIAGFLQLCEDENLHDARALSQLFLNVATKWVHDNGGTLLRVCADTVVATWGAILPVKDAELKATMCAMDISETLGNMRKKLYFEFDWTCIVLSGAMVAGSAGTVAEKTSVIYGKALELLEELPSLMTALQAPVVITAEVKEKVLSSTKKGSMHQQWHALPIDNLSLCNIEDPDTVQGQVRLFELRMGPSKEYLPGVEAGFTALAVNDDVEGACELLQQTISEHVEEAAQDEQLLRLYRLALWSHVQGQAYRRATPLWQRNIAELAQMADPFGANAGSNSNNSASVFNFSGAAAAFGAPAGGGGGGTGDEEDGSGGPFCEHAPEDDDNNDDSVSPSRFNQSATFGQSFLSPFGAPGGRRYNAIQSRRRSTHIDDSLRQQLLNFSSQFSAPKPTSRVPSRMGAAPLAPGGGGEGGSNNQLQIPGGGGVGSTSRAGSSLGGAMVMVGAASINSAGSGGGGRSRNVSFISHSPLRRANASIGSAGTPSAVSLSSPQQAGLLLRSTGSSPRSTPLPGSQAASAASSPGKQQHPPIFGGGVGGGSPASASLSGKGAGSPLAVSLAVPPIPSAAVASNVGSSGGSSPRESPRKQRYGPGMMNNSLTGMAPLIQVTGSESRGGSKKNSPQSSMAQHPIAATAAAGGGAGEGSPKIAPLSTAQLQQQRSISAASSSSSRQQQQQGNLNNTVNTLATSFDGSPSSNNSSSPQHPSPSPPRLNQSSTSLVSPPAVDPNKKLASPSPAGSALSPSVIRDTRHFVIKDKKGLTFRVSETSCLGKGAFGEVYMGLTETGCPVAVKMVNVPAVDDASKAAAAADESAKPKASGVAARRAKRKGKPVAKSEDVKKEIEAVLVEVQVLSALRHENVVGYISSAVLRQLDRDSGQIKTKLAVIMEFVPGGSLAALLTKLKSPPNEQTAVRYLRDILKGLEFLHESGYIHRDLKPGNALLLSDGGVKLTDFGTAVNTGRLAGDTEMMGTPQYMPPETCRGEKPTDVSDVWSFGILMAEVLTGSVPWPTEPGVPFSPIRFIYQVGHADSMVPQLDDSIPAEAKRVIRMCCERDSSKRPTVKELLALDYFGRVDARLSKMGAAAGGGLLSPTQLAGATAGGAASGMVGDRGGSSGGMLGERSFSTGGTSAAALGNNATLGASLNATALYAGRSPTRSMPGSGLRSPMSVGGGGSPSTAGPGGVSLGASLRVPTTSMTRGGGNSPRSNSPGDVSRQNASGNTTPLRSAGVGRSPSTGTLGALPLQTAPRSNNINRPSSLAAMTPISPMSHLAEVGHDDDDDDDDPVVKRASASVKSDSGFLDVNDAAAAAAAVASEQEQAKNASGAPLFELVTSADSSKRNSFYDSG